jgi:hypothetical protein
VPGVCGGVRPPLRVARGEVHRGGELPPVHAVPNWAERVVRVGRWVRWMGRRTQGRHCCMGHNALLDCRKLLLD